MKQMYIICIYIYKYLNLFACLKVFKYLSRLGMAGVLHRDN